MSAVVQSYEPAILATGLVKRYAVAGGDKRGDKHRVRDDTHSARADRGVRDVLAGVDLRVETGEVFGLLGPNGAGKTTLVETIAGLRRPSDGLVRVSGLDPYTQREELTRLLAVQPQAAALFPTLTARETLELFGSFYSAARSPEESLRAVGLEDAAATRVSHLSGGQARRLLIGVALVGRPRIAILDEPSAGLDPAARRELWRVVSELRQQGATVLLTTHHMEEAAELCDRIAILAAGRIVALGTPDDLTREHASESEVRFAVTDGSRREQLLRVLGAGSRVAAHIVGDPEVAEAPGALLVSLRTADPDELLRAITFTRGLHASGVQVRRTTLEDVYLRLIGTGESASTGESPGQ